MINYNFNLGKYEINKARSNQERWQVFRDGEVSNANFGTVVEAENYIKRKIEKEIQDTFNHIC